MSNFTCEHCGIPIIDSNLGYITGCQHYPLKTAQEAELFEDLAAKYEFDANIERKRAEAIAMRDVIKKRAAQ